DDWPSLIKEQGIMGGFWYKKVHEAMNELFAQSDLLLSISDQMALEYKNRYGRDFITFHNPINIDFWAKYRRTDFKLSDNPSILYAGRVGTGIDTSLQTIAKSVREVNKELSISLTFILQTAEKPS